MEILKITALSGFSFAVLFFLTKLMGYRQISEMSFFDYIVGITIGSIAAETATGIDTRWWRGVIAMAVYAAAEIILSFAERKNLSIRGFISGKPIILMKNGKLLRSALKKARLDVNDFLAAARRAGYFTLSDIDCAIMENTGKISFLPVPLKRQLNPKDFNFAPFHSGLCTNLVIDGKIIGKNLKYADMTEKQIKKYLSDRNTDISDVLLMTIDECGKIEIFSTESQCKQ